MADRIITKLQIQNFRGIRQLEIEPGAVTKLKGLNTAGKSSVLMAIAAALGHKPETTELVRDGENRALVLIETDDGLTIRKSIRRGGASGAVSVTEADAKWREPQTKLNALLGSKFGLNPIDFLDLTPRDQAKLLLEHTRIPDQTEDDWARLTGGKLLDGVDYSQHPLQVLADLERGVYQQRQEVNRELKMQEAALAERRTGIPDGFGEIEAKAVEAVDLRAQTDELAQIRQANNERRAVKAKLESLGKERERLDAEVKANQTEIEACMQYLADKPLIQEGAEAALEEAIAAFQDDTRALMEYRAAGTIQERVDDLKAESELLTIRLEQIRGMPQEMIKEGEPVIDSLDVGAGGQVTVYGRPIQDLSTGEQLDVATSVAMASAGDLKVLLLDRFESLDAFGQERILKRAREAGFQVFVTEVGDGKLTIEAYGEEEAGHD